MKVVSASTMAEIESRAYQEGYQEEDFMEKAGEGIAFATQAFVQEHRLPRRIWLLCGKGNNGGDAFVAGRYLLRAGYFVTALLLAAPGECSPLCRRNQERFTDQGGHLLKDIPELDSGVLLDGIFGTGFRGTIQGPYASLIEKANKSKCPLLAIDIPSGLDGSTGEVSGPAIRATETFFLGLPKIGFFLKEGWNFVGKLRHIDFGLPLSFSEQAAAPFELLSQEEVSAWLPPIKRNRHKYQAGYVIGLAGSLTMPGAALLSSLAALRGGSGMVRLFYPKGMEAELAGSPYELIKLPYSYDQPQEVLETMQKAKATFVGPGLGRSEQVLQVLKQVLPFLSQPCVIDADALTLFAEHPFSLPSQTILSPHTGEMQKLLGSSSSLSLDLELLETCQKYAEEHRVTLILKGAPTFIFHPKKRPFVNPTGDPGMATAGSGDVLTGLLASLLSQGLDCHKAALLGVYLHGLAGELAAKERRTSYGMMATDLIAQFGSAYESLLSKVSNL